jgi:hypothetical protein
LPARWRAIRRERAGLEAAHSIGGVAGEQAGQRPLETRRRARGGHALARRSRARVAGFSPAAFDHDQLVHAQGLCQGAEASYGPFFAVSSASCAWRASGRGPARDPEEFQVEDPLWNELAPRLDRRPSARGRSA